MVYDSPQTYHIRMAGIKHLLRGMGLHPKELVLDGAGISWKKLTSAGAVFLCKWMGMIYD